MEFYKRIQNQAETINVQKNNFSAIIQTHIDESIFLVNLDSNISNYDKNNLIRWYNKLGEILKKKDAEWTSEFADQLREIMEIEISNSQITEKLLSMIQLLGHIEEISGV